MLTSSGYFIVCTPPWTLGLGSCWSLADDAKSGFLVLATAFWLRIQMSTGPI